MSTPATAQYRFSAGVLALLVHVAFFALMVFGISWQAKAPQGVVVDLWSNLPAPPTPPAMAPRPPPPPPAPEPVKKIEPKPAPPAPRQKADIALKEKRKQQEEQLKEEKLKQQAAARKQAQKERELEEQALKEQQKEEQARQAKALADQQAQETLARLTQAKQAAAQQSIVDDYTNRISAKIRGKLNKTLCGDGKPLLVFDINLLPTGQLLGNPVLRQGSGIAACDRAVENAILQSDPLPVPPQPELFSRFRELHLKFRPNE